MARIRVRFDPAQLGWTDKAGRLNAGSLTKEDAESRFWFKSGYYSKSPFSLTVNYFDSQIIIADAKGDVQHRAEMTGPEDVEAANWVAANKAQPKEKAEVVFDESGNIAGDEE